MRQPKETKENGYRLRGGDFMQRELPNIVSTWKLNELFRNTNDIFRIMEF